MKNDPALTEPRWPAILIWTVSGLLLGLALFIISGVAVPILVGGGIGFAVGLFVTRVKYVPEDD